MNRLYTHCLELLHHQEGHAARMTAHDRRCQNSVCSFVCNSMRNIVCNSLKKSRLHTVRLLQSMPDKGRKQQAKPKKVQEQGAKCRESLYCTRRLQQRLYADACLSAGSAARLQSCDSQPAVSLQSCGSHAAELTWSAYRVRALPEQPAATVIRKRQETGRLS